jgi:hypothetical protein
MTWPQPNITPTSRTHAPGTTSAGQLLVVIEEVVGVAPCYKALLIGVAPSTPETIATPRQQTPTYRHGCNNGQLQPARTWHHQRGAEGQLLVVVEEVVVVVAAEAGIGLADPQYAGEVRCADCMQPSMNKKKS